LQPFDPPDLTINDAIERGWQIPPDHRLLAPLPKKFLTIEPSHDRWR
jgi:hypothetical protein